MKTTLFRRDLHVYRPGTIGREVERRTGTPLAVGIFLVLAVVGVGVFIFGLIIGIAL